MQKDENDYHEKLNSIKREHESAYAKLETDNEKEI